MNESYNFQTISKFRSELMGMGMLGVLVVHMLFWTGNSDFHAFQFLWDNIIGVIYVEGFIILSGFGLYHSVSRSVNIGWWGYFKRRITRFYIPYILLSLPFFISLYCVGEMDGLRFCEEVIGIGSILNKNNYGMWYVSATLICYLFFPLMYKFIIGRHYIAKGLVIMMLIQVLCKIVAKSDYPPIQTFL